MRLGILGGSFDPVHYGHLLLAESCREACRLDQVWFLPAAIPPHKQHHQLAPPEQRVEMLELAIAGHAGFAVCVDEIDRGGVNYTVDTLTHLHEQDSSRELFFLLGADTLADFPTWREPGRVCELAMPVIVRRASDAATPLALSGMSELVSPGRLKAIREHIVAMPRLDLSSTDIRQRVSDGLSIRYRTPRAVEKYIETHLLYRCGA